MKVETHGLDDHFIRHGQKLLECYYCPKLFDNYDQITAHEWNEHVKDNLVMTHELNACVKAEHVTAHEFNKHVKDNRVTAHEWNEHDKDKSWHMN